MSPVSARAVSLTAIVLALGAIPASSRAQSPTPASSPLRVIRTTPTGAGSALTEVTITFDRPVAGSLDRTVDPAGIITTAPAIAGRIEWRDPVTIRLVPSRPLTPGTRYTVTVANNFKAMDGSELAEPHRFTFRVQGPTILAFFPVPIEGGSARVINPTGKLEVVYSAAVDLTKLTNASFVEVPPSCGGDRIIRLRATSQRPVAPSERRRFREAGGEERARALDTLRRVVEMTPATPIPRGCAATVVLPTEVEDQAIGIFTRWPVQTWGDFRLAEVKCDSNDNCPTGPLYLRFSTPVRGSEVLRHIRFIPDAKFTISDTTDESTIWALDGKLDPRTGYAIVADTGIRDILGQRLVGNPAIGYRTTGYLPSVAYPYGAQLVERVGFRTLSVRHMNVDTLIATIAPVPDSMEAKILGRYRWTDDSVWIKLRARATVQRVAVKNMRDRAGLAPIQLPLGDARRPGSPTLYAVRISAKAGAAQVVDPGPVALLQVTDLGVHVKLGATDGAVWVTSVSTGAAKVGASVTLFDSKGQRLATARTDARGLARVTGWPVPPSVNGDDDRDWRGLDGYVKVSLLDDQAVGAVNDYDPDLSPWNFGTYGAWGDERIPVAGGVFTERGIYRPGERVYAKAIVRDGALGSLRAPAVGDSIRWTFHDRDEGVIREATVRLSAFGTSDQSIIVPNVAPVGYYRISVEVKRRGEWRTVGYTGYRVAEYRPPEFLVTMVPDTGIKKPGDSFAALVQSRYLFGAPMGRAEVNWFARRNTMSPWELDIPGFDDWYMGQTSSWWENVGDGDEVFASGVDTLDVRGERTLRVTIPPGRAGRPSRITIETSITDINRQVVGSATSVVVHPADFYVAVKPRGTNYFWAAGTPQATAIAAVRPDGRIVPNVRVQGTIVRREWHRVRRERNGISELVGEWVSDTVGSCTVVTTTSAGNDAPTCAFTPKAGGVYSLTFTATDAGGRRAISGYQRWASGTDWVPWSDETQFKMDVIADKSRYAVGDTATVLFAAPFTNAEAWIAIEREGVIDQRRIRVTSGSTTLKFPITEAFAPNAFVSIVLARGRSAPPGPLDDPGRPTIRVGYTELRVTPEVKRLTVTLAANKPEYRPGDSATVRISVADAQKRGARSEVTLWAVDEGVLALTGYKTPDPIDLIYRPRGLGMRLASNMTAVAPQVPEGEKGRREPGGGGGADGADVLRSRFQTTAFFLGSVATDVAGVGSATVKLPDNLTTFRVMAVAVTAGDRYGNGESSMLVTRPLLARPALPRFVRPGDQFNAGAVINRRDGAAVDVRVKALSTGVTLRGDAERTTKLEASRGAEVRFPFTATRTDSATFRFDVAGTGASRDSDAVRLTIPVKPDHHPRAHTIAGVLRDSANVEFALPAGIDPARSRLTLNLGSSPLAMIKGINRSLRIYPYFCSEQVISAAVPLVALLRAQMQAGTDPIVAGLDASAMRADLTRGVEMLSRRQREDGGIGYWSSSDWTSPWLSAYAGIVLLDARDAGVRVDSTVLAKLSDYISTSLHNVVEMNGTPLVRWYQQREMRLRDQVAAADFLSRMGKPDIPAENELLRAAGLLAIEDRARLAEVLARRGQVAPARQLLAPTWAQIRVEGRRAVLPDSANAFFYFESSLRPVARILTATLAIDPQNALLGPLLETLVQQGRTGRGLWNTQDYSSVVTALAAYDRRNRESGDRTVRVRSGSRTVLQSSTTAGAGTDSSIALTGLLADGQGGRVLRLALDASAGSANVYYYLTVTEIPSAAPTTPEDRGIVVERWYERFTGGQPVTSVAEGELVRVRLRVTVPAMRQFVVLDDALPAGLEAVDLSLRTASAMPGPGGNPSTEGVDHDEREASFVIQWGFGRWDSGWWSPWDHRELRDDRVIYSATMLWAGTYTATYVARATTAGTFIRPPAHAEEMYNPAVNGRSDGGTFTVTMRQR